MSKDHFQGFSHEGLAFLDTLLTTQFNLEFDEARAYYTANKPLYERALKTPMGLLVEDLSAALKADGVPIKGDRHSSLFRINRDVRFARDKRPYKTTFSAAICPQGRNSGLPAYYFHITETAELLIAGGVYMPAPPILSQIRREARILQQHLSDLHIDRLVVNE